MNSDTLDACSTSVLPHKLYLMTYQLISEVAFDRRSKYSSREAIEKILGILGDNLFLNMGRVLLPNHYNSRLLFRYSHGLNKEKRLVDYEIHQGITGLIYSSEQSIFADDLDTNSMYVGKLCGANELPYADPAIIGVPIFRSNKGIMGVLCVNHGYRGTKEISEIEQVLEGTATLIAQIIERSVRKHKYNNTINKVVCKLN